MSKLGIQVEITPTVDTSAYGSGDQIGTVFTITPVSDAGGAHLAVLDTVIVTDKASQSAALDILLFDELPTVASADQAACNVSDAEMADKCIGVISLASASYKALSANSVVMAHQLSLSLKPKKDNTLYGLLVSRGTPTYTSASDLTIKFVFE